MKFRESLLQLNQIPEEKYVLEATVLFIKQNQCDTLIEKEINYSCSVLPESIVAITLIACHNSY